MSPGSNSRRVTLPICLTLAAAVLAAFWPVMRCDFVEYDDPDYVTRNPQVQGGLTPTGVVWALRAMHAANWHPVTWLSHMLDVQVFGMRSGAHHLTSLMLHAANTVLLFLLLRSMTGALWRSAFAAALFGVHPLRVESVAWVAERKDVLSGLFFLLTLAAYVRYARAVGQPAERRGYFWAAASFLALGLASKPMLVTTPLVLQILDYWPLGRLEPVDHSASPDSPSLLRRVRQLAVEKLPFFALAAVSCAMTVLAQKLGHTIESFEALSPYQRLANAVVSYVRYLGKLLWPSDLSVFYRHPRTWNPWMVLAAVALLVALTWGALAARRGARYLAAGWLWYATMLVPVIGLIQVGRQSIADRYTYLPSIGLCVGLAWGLAALARVAPSCRLLVIAAALAVLPGLAVATRRQVQYWSSTRSLFQHALALDPLNYIAASNLGIFVAKEGRRGDAIEYFRRAVEAEPRFANGYNNWGFALAQMERFDEAIPKYEQALEINPRLVQARNNLEAARAALRAQRTGPRK
jgi:tetratricopeptide (TPR) repeat protein